MINLHNISPVAILILLELTLQYECVHEEQIRGISRNPYFIGINSAIMLIEF